MSKDWRINWAMPLQPLGELVVETKPDVPVASPAEPSNLTDGDMVGLGIEAELPDGVWDAGPDGNYMAKCCCCGYSGEIYCDISEIPPVGYQHYCGRGPSCCP